MSDIVCLGCDDIAVGLNMFSWPESVLVCFDMLQKYSGWLNRNG